MEKKLEIVKTIILALTLIAGMYLGIRQNNISNIQNQISNELRNIASLQLKSEKSPLLSIEIQGFKYEPQIDRLSFKVLAKNRGTVPIITYTPSIEFSTNRPSPLYIEKLEATPLPILFPGEEGLLWSEDSKGWGWSLLNTPVNPLILVSIKFSSLYASDTEFCFQRIFEYDLNTQSLIPRILTPDCRESF